MIRSSGKYIFGNAKKADFYVDKEVIAGIRFGFPDKNSRSLVKDRPAKYSD